MRNCFNCSDEGIVEQLFTKTIKCKTYLQNIKMFSLPNFYRFKLFRQGSKQTIVATKRVLQCQINCYKTIPARIIIKQLMPGTNYYKTTPARNQ